MYDIVVERWDLCKIFTKCMVVWCSEGGYVVVTLTNNTHNSYNIRNERSFILDLHDTYKLLNVH